MDTPEQDGLSVALSMYIGEPCRICGKPIKASDINTAVFAGYSADNRSRTAHEKCWNEQPPKVQWAFPE